MNFTANIRNDTAPEESGSFVESIKVAKVSAEDIVNMDNIITRVPVRNDV